MDSEYEKRLKEVKLREAEAKARKAEEEVLHEEQKRKKTRAETRKTVGTEVHEVFKIFGTVAGTMAVIITIGLQGKKLYDELAA